MSGNVATPPSSAAAASSQFISATSADVAVTPPLTPASHPDGSPVTDPVAHALRNGIDDGYPRTKTGRAKRSSSKRCDDEDTADIERHRFLASHIKRAFDLFGYIPTIINNGIKRRARSQIGESIDGIMTAREYSTFEKIIQHIPGLDIDIVRFCDDPLKFRDLIQVIQESAHSARSNDVSNIKKDLGYLLSDYNSSIMKNIITPCMDNDKSSRGFHDEITGRYLCPTIYDWDNTVDKQKLRDGNYAVTADVFPRLLYANCSFNPEDMEEGLGRNLALVRVVKYIFTGRSAAISATAGGKTTRASNAQLARMTRITPNAIAYGACILRFALSETATWTKIDVEFDMEVFYWNVVDIFHDDKFSDDLLAWWNWKVFGINIDADGPVVIVPPPMSSMAILSEQRAAKRARLLNESSTEGPSMQVGTNGVSLVEAGGISARQN